MGPRTRPRLSRTLARARWREYRLLLEAALEHGYSVLGVEDWVAGSDPGGPVMAVRHDVDQDPRAALTMAGIERELGLRTSWYFRWRTAEPRVVAELRGEGCGVGFHYETLSRLALERGAWTAAEIERLLPAARAGLGEEIDAFARLHGPIRSVCPHGDSRAPLARNAGLMKGREPREFGVEFDVNEAMRGRGLARWLTDRTLAEGRWADGIEPLGSIAAGDSPLLCVVHPNNWSSGPSLWLDRLRGTRVDAPPA